MVDLRHALYYLNRSISGHVNRPTFHRTSRTSQWAVTGSCLCPQSSLFCHCSVHKFSQSHRSVCIFEPHSEMKHTALVCGVAAFAHITHSLAKGRLPVNISLAAMSATLPEHVLDDIRAGLKLSEDAHVVAITNARQP